ncbi:hypothetical protein SLEP1_g8691 [Rubroshorea leprosula]|uniref:Reverse transcriptase domain-containing protein n=1 Tax=Rubroshorea leprosula TaxID=152421 RepID=A0AAV5IDM1_9ROSI|nr:hypothetical protein SLEP1_g8691 [Rubroshorea leprosula]
MSFSLLIKFPYVADDLIVFADGKASSLAAIDDILKSFYSVSGLKVNYAKSEHFCCGIPASESTALYLSLWIKIGTLPVRYLGVPLIAGRLTGKVLKSLVSKISDRMNSWTSKHLSFTGQLQLIFSVIQGVTTFWCLTFILPKKVIKEIERLCSAFLRNNSTDSAKGANMCWQSVCSPK